MNSAPQLHGNTTPAISESHELIRPLSFEELAQQERSPIYDYIRILKKRKWIIIYQTLILTTLVAIYSFRKTPIYEASGRIAVNRQGENIFNLTGAEPVGEDYDYVVALDTQVKVLQSDALALKVIKELGLDKNPAFAGDLASGQNSEQALDVAALETDLVDMFHSALSVNSLTRTRIIEVRFQSPDPRLAAEVVNTLAKGYIEHNFQTKYDATMQAASWLSKQLGDLQMKVESSEEKLVDYQKTAGMLGIDEKQNIVTAKLDQLNQELTVAQADRIQKESQFRLAETGDPELMAREGMGELFAKLRSQETDLQIQLAQLSTSLGPSHPKALELKNQLQEIQSQLSFEQSRIREKMQRAYLAAVSRERMLTQALEAQKQEANRLNEASIRYNLLKREAETNRQLYEGLLQRIKEASVAAGLQSSNIRIVDLARVPTAPAKPNIPLNILVGLMLGLGSGVVLAFVIDMLDNTVQTPEQVEQFGLASLGMIPAGRGRTAAPKVKLLTAKSEPATSSPLLVHVSPQSQVAEAYRALRTSILLASFGEPPRVILVTSALPQEGKTTISVNIALTLAQRGGKVLLVDCDLRRPTVGKSFGLPPGRGISTLLADQRAKPEIHHPLPSLPNFCVMASGPRPPHPAEMLGSPVMSELIAHWRQEYDHIVIDSPPILSVTDAVVLSRESDGVLLVARARRTTKQALRRARDLLAKVNAGVMGVVVNGVDLASPDYYYYYGYHGYGYANYYTSDEVRQPEEVAPDND